MPETLLSIDELADTLNVSPATVRRHLPELPHIKLGRVVRFQPDAVLDSLRNNSDSAKAGVAS